MSGPPPVVARYWCHQCSRMVSPVVEAEIECPACRGGFVEEMEMRPDDPAEALLGDAPSLWTPIVLTMMHMGASRRRREGDGEGDGNAPTDHRRARGDAISMLELLHGLRAIAAEEEEQDVVVVDPFLPGAAHVGVTLGDYFVGPGFDRLLQQLAEGDPSRQGTPPARKEAVEALPTIRVAERASCPVCLDELEVGGEAREMPCKHAFHGGCLLPWLEAHSSCPVCRFQLPVEGEEAAARSRGGGDGGRGSWMWPFNALFSSEREPSGGSGGDGRRSF